MNLRNRILQAGFTMIELLVVIAVIGVLAVAVLSSINPIEQINKGRDTRTRSDAAQLINAADRFFASQERYPWNVNAFACAGGCSPILDEDQENPSAEFPQDMPAAVCTAVASGLGVGMCRLGTTGSDWMDGLVSTAEVKSGFIDRIRGQTTYSIYVYKDGIGGASMYSCFQPSSEAFRQEAISNCSSPTVTGGWPTTVLGAACPGTNPGESNYAPSGDNSELICLP